MCERKRAYQGGEAAPSKAGTRKRPFCLFSPQRQENTKKRRKNHLIFLQSRVNCCLEPVFRPSDTASMLISSVFSAKNICKPAKFQSVIFAPRDEIYQQGPLCLRVLLGVSLSFWEQVLGGTHVFTHGDASGFFLFFRLLPTFFPKVIWKLSGMTKKVVPFKCLGIYNNRT